MSAELQELRWLLLVGAAVDLAFFAICALSLLDAFFLHYDTIFLQYDHVRELAMIPTIRKRVSAGNSDLTPPFACPPEMSGQLARRCTAVC